MRRIKIEAPVSKKKDEEEIYIGIDLGTTNSLATFCNSNERGSVIVCDITPSVVTFFEDGSFEVGNLEYSRKGIGVTLSSVKRKIGTEERFEVFGKTYSPEEISAFILSHIKQKAEESLNKKITGAVITVPAYFDDAQKTATKAAGEMAGLKVLRVLSEPTSAAVFFDIENKKEGFYAVYDLGGGTFDVSILQMKMGVLKVLAVGGDSCLGGDDFDDIVSKKLGITKLDARKIKEEVSITGKSGNFEIDEFDDLILPLIHKTVDIFKSTIIEANIKFKDLEGIILVGGSTKLPIIKEAIKTEFNVKVFEGTDPDRIVALGAGLYAFNILHRTGNMLLDVCPLSLGIETLNGLSLKVIPRNSQIPIEMKTELTTGEDFQTGVKIHIIQGEREFAKDCRSLARIEITEIPPMPKGLAQISLSFVLDEDGILSVFAEEQISKKKVEIQVRPSYNLKTSDVRQMFEDAMQYGKTDMQKRLLEEAKLEAKNIISSAELLLKSAKDEGLLNLVQKLESVIQSESEEEIKKAIDEIRLSLSKNQH